MSQVSTSPGAEGLPSFPWSDYVRRFEIGEWRAPIFRDMVAFDLEACGQPPTLLDIGCGRGFDDSRELQSWLVDKAGKFVGIEPDEAREPPAGCDEFYRGTMETADIAAESVDVAIATFVLEHVGRPDLFLEAVHRVLKPDGVLWLFTVDARSPFAVSSRILERIGLKTRYLDYAFGAGDGRHSNYPTVYAANTPRELRSLTTSFRSCEIASLHRVGILDPVLPPAARPFMRLIDRATLRFDWPGTNLAVRLVK